MFSNAIDAKDDAGGRRGGPNEKSGVSFERSRTGFSWIDGEKFDPDRKEYLHTYNWSLNEKTACVVYNIRTYFAVVLERILGRLELASFA